MKIVPITTKVRGNDGRIWHVPLHTKLLDCARCGTAMSLSLIEQPLDVQLGQLLANKKGLVDVVENAHWLILTPS